jgi:iron(II)-dependent oxidoreductase
MFRTVLQAKLIAATQWFPMLGSIVVATAGLFSGRVALLAVGLAALAITFLMRMRKRSSDKNASAETVVASAFPATNGAAPKSVTVPSAEGASDLTALIEEMLGHGRYCLLLRQQIVAGLTTEQLERTVQALTAGMAVVPAGEVMLGEGDQPYEDGRFTDEEVDRYRLARVSVEDYFLDRYLITNRQYQQFVSAGGYEQAALWDPAILTAVLDFVDQTGFPGPRFWRNGRYKPGHDEHPVVGISWYEAAAYARWVGKRLPTDAEWVKSASWPVLVGSGVWQQRKYPWGNAFEPTRANLWGCGPGHTVPVDQYNSGISVGGAYQLIGNVWEWTNSDFGYDDVEGPLLSEPASAAVMRCLRGGAFDTYFESQATCQFRSGDHPMARKHKIGFRCAISACD